jgi:glycine cleavage system aminomethyltransferase T
MEKGYRYYGTDMTMQETPYEAGSGVFVHLDKGEFVGRAALQAERERRSDPAARRLWTLRLGEDEWQPVYGGEAVRQDGVVIGRLRSVAYGPTVPAMIGYAYGPQTFAEGQTLTVDVFGEHLPATIGPDVLVDPSGARMRG